MRWAWGDSRAWVLQAGIWLGGVGLALGIPMILWRRRVGRGRTPTGPTRTPADREREQVFHHFGALCRLLQRQGLPRHDHETPFEYAAAVAACVPAVAAPVEVIAQAYVAGRYSDGPLPSEQVQASAHAWRTLPGHLREARRTSPRENWARKPEDLPTPPPPLFPED